VLTRPIAPAATTHQPSGAVRETEAVLLIYSKCRTEESTLISSEVIEAEVAQTPNKAKVEQIMLALAIA